MVPKIVNGTNYVVFVCVCDIIFSFLFLVISLLLRTAQYFNLSINMLIDGSSLFYSFK